MAKINYQEASDRLQQILTELENHELPMDQLTKLVKEAAKLIKTCKTALRNTEKEIDNALNGLDEPLE